MLTDTISTPGWWLTEHISGGRGDGPETTIRSALPFGKTDLQFAFYKDESCECAYGRVERPRRISYTHDPEAVLAWVRDGVLP